MSTIKELPHTEKKLFITDKFLAFIFLKYIPLYIRPNHITLLRLLLIPVVAWFLLSDRYILGSITFLFAAFTDALDGMVARVRDQITDWGKLFDPLADKLLLFTAFIILAIPRVSMWVLAALFMIEITFIIAGIVYRGLGHHPQANIWGKIKMLLEVIGVIFLFLSIIFHIPLLVTVCTTFFIFAIIFGVISLVTQGI